ncbi:TPA: hypothetical protein GXX44_02690 [bacterium]|nr:hypothetical protein [bacterium]
MSIIFMLALSILLVAVLLLSNQEIYATQVCLNGNKAFYYAEAGVEYAQAQLLNGKSVDELNQSSVDELLKDKLGVSSLNLQVEKPSSSEYTLTCEVNYNKTNRKIVKKIKLKTSLWEKAMAAGKNMNIGTTENNTTVAIKGDIAANGTVNINAQILVNPSSTESDAKLEFPSLFDYYLSKVTITYNKGDDFVNAMINNQIPSGAVVLIRDSLQLNALNNLQFPSGVVILVEGDLTHTNNADITNTVTTNMAIFITKGKFHINSVNVNLSNYVFYVENSDLKEEKAILINNISFNLQNGAIYGVNGNIDIKNTNAPAYFTLDRGNWKYNDLPYLSGYYEGQGGYYYLLSWSDLGA